MTWTLSYLSIQGVKGVLDRAGDFNLSPKKGKPRSIAIFGRNGYGKSSYADAIEYLFSVDGGVAHLGKGGADTEQGGKHAIPHVLATEREIIPSVTAEFTRLKDGKEDGKPISATRLVVTGRNDTRPAEIEPVIAQAPAHRILRQHDLRRFVVDMTPGEKFSEFARWIGLESTANLLRHITTVERTLKDTDVDREIAERLNSIVGHTSGAISSYDEAAILQWCETETAKHIQQSLPIRRPIDIDAAMRALREQRELLFVQSQTAKEQSIRDDIQRAAKSLIDVKGPMRLLETALNDTISAEKAKAEAQGKAKQSIFQEVWDSAQKLLDKQKTDTCPVCNTPWEGTAAGSLENAVIALSTSLASLADYRLVQSAYLQHEQNLKSRLQALESALSNIENHAKALSLLAIVNEASQIRSAYAELRLSKIVVQSLQAPIVDLAGKCAIFANDSLPQALFAKPIASPPVPVSQIDSTIAHLQAIQEALSRLEALARQQIAIRTVERQFGKIADRIRAETKAIAENAINALRSDVRTIYKKIHPEESIPDVFIKLNTDEKTLAIRVNFHSADRTVPPGGYLSEAQINTLGLALFLSSVRLFNKEFPFVFLDDIVSSYDADNRARIVDVLAEEMAGFQIFLTTHDERFYTHLQGRLKSENWQFERISGYEFKRGPRRESDNLKLEQIDTLITQGDQLAGNAVRQFMEDWFDNVCDRFYVYTLHKKGSKDYKRTLFDYWEPFVDKIKGMKGEVGKLALASDAYKRFDGSLFPIINYYSHNQTNPYEWASAGDIVYIWGAFKGFRLLFHCSSCGKLLQYHFEDKKLYCTCGGAIVAPPKLTA